LRIESCVGRSRPYLGRPPQARPLLAVFLLVLLGACARSPASNTESAAVPEFYGLTYSYQDAELIYKAESAVIARCMSERGFDRFLTPGFIPSPELARGGDRRWGIVDSSSGYHADNDLSKVAAKADAALAAENEFYNAMSAEQRDAYFMALDGSPYAVSTPVVSTASVTIPGSSNIVQMQLAGSPDSCERAVHEELGQDVETFQALQVAVGKAAADVDRMASEDKAFGSTMKAWSKCFKAGGFEASDPLDAADRYEADADSPTKAEIEAASVDVSCKESTGLGDAWRAAIERAEHVVGENIVPELEYWREVRADVVEHAKAILADTSESSSVTVDVG